MNIFVFDIETIPDTENGKQLHGISDLPQEQIAEAMFKLRRDKTGDDFMPHYLQKIVAISVLLRSPSEIKIWSLGDESAPEAELIQRFFTGLERYTPVLVSWNGSGFDLPVLHYRSLLHGTVASRYWEAGEHDQNFRWNNYLNRYHTRHTDLMDILAGYQARANAPLDHLATMLGFPGKVGMCGADVWHCYQQGAIKKIRDYCETDVLNTYLVYLRYQLISGQLPLNRYHEECTLLRNTLAAAEQAHFDEFLTHWTNVK